LCIAMADGRVTRFERHLILANAKQILQPDEYQQFKEYINQVSPPVPTATRYTTKMIGAAQNRQPTVVQHRTPSPVKRLPAPTDSGEIFVTDSVASAGVAR
jgi:hypothetical protein